MLKGKVWGCSTFSLTSQKNSFDISKRFIAAIFKVWECSTSNFVYFFLTSQMNRFEISTRFKAAFAPFNVLTERLFVLSISCLSCFFRKVLLRNRNACFGSTLGPLKKSRNSPINAFFQTGAIKSKTLKKKTAPESPFSQCCTLPACNFLERDTVICFNEFCKIVTNNLFLHFN